LVQAMNWLKTGVLDPQGPVATSQLQILINATVIMLAVIVPVIVLTLAFAWWFRAGNKRAKYKPDWAYSGQIELIVWSIPTLIVLFLGGIAWIGSHDLDPRKPLVSANPAVTIQVVSLDWKWLFIYPEQEIASVNRLVMPVGTPVKFQITSATVMNSFFVPQLGSQIYAMSGMTTELNLQADRAGSYPGFSAQFSGEGFSGMRFNADAMPKAEFDAWVANAKQDGSQLDPESYDELAKPSSAVPPMTYGAVAPDMFGHVLRGGQPMASAMGKASQPMPMHQQRN
jgi:cytochrome o ubiquinol oxidase subunit 2